MASKLSNGYGLLRTLALESSHAAIDKFWRGIQKHTGFVTIPLIKLRWAGIYGLHASPASYCYELSPFDSPLDWWNFAVRNGVRPQNFDLNRSIEFIVNGLAVQYGQEKLLLSKRGEKIWAEFVAAEAEAKLKKDATKLARSQELYTQFQAQISRSKVTEKSRLAPLTKASAKAVNEFRINLSAALRQDYVLPSGYYALVKYRIDGAEQFEGRTISGRGKVKEPSAESGVKRTRNKKNYEPLIKSLSSTGIVEILAFTNLKMYRQAGFEMRPLLFRQTLLEVRGERLSDIDREILEKKEEMDRLLGLRKKIKEEEV